MAKTKQKNNKNTKIVAALLVVLVLIVVYVAFTLFRGVNDTLADNSYSIWKTQGYDVRACRPLKDSKSTYNGITAYVLPTTNTAKSQFNKFVVKFVNTVDTSQVYDSGKGQGLAQVTEYKNPYGVNAAMSATVYLKNGTAVVPYPSAVVKIKPCP